MKTLAAVLAVAAVLVAPAALACVNGMNLERFERKENLVANASKAYRAGHYAEAASIADKALAGKVSDADRRALLRTAGLANLKLGQFDKSVASFDALVKEKKEPFVQAKLAEAQLRAAGFSGSGKDALEKLATDGLLSDADAWTALAQARVVAGDPAGAKAACEEALKVQPGHPEATQLAATLSAPKPPSAPVKPSSKS